MDSPRFFFRHFTLSIHRKRRGTVVVLYIPLNIAPSPRFFAHVFCMYWRVWDGKGERGKKGWKIWFARLGWSVWAVATSLETKYTYVYMYRICRQSTSMAVR